uniref:C3H1-type domain-containing protein n=1 Tax=Strigamia maritima TaxID=126957 RepID=T1J600_STRMM
MTTALVSACYGITETFSKSNGYTKAHMKVGERKSVPNFTVRRTSTPTATNLSTCFANNRLNVIAITSEAAAVLANNQTTNNHRKLDRSLSEPVDRSSLQQQQQQQQAQRAVPTNSSRYKTELCRPYEESGKCKYGDKCQFAHGAHELRTLARHPKYKTELCRTFHTTGFCPYGPRCHFIHNAEGPPPPNGGSMPDSTTIVRPKALCFSGGSSGSASPNGDLPTPSPPHNCNNSYFEPVTTPTANNAFTFNSQDFSVLVSPPLSINRRVLEQNAYNTALNQFTLLSNGQRNLNIMNDSDSVFSDPASSDLSSPPPPSPPSSSDSQSLGSDGDDLSVCGSPPGDDGRCGALRLPIFSRLSTSED